MAYDNNGVDSLKRLDRGRMRVHLEQLNPWLPTPRRFVVEREAT